jgi:AraC family ethanolamine operon transcriptional activator
MSVLPVTLREFQFNSIEALQDITPDSQSDVVQISTGRMSGSVSHLKFGSIGLSTGTFSRAIRARGVLSPTRWCLCTMMESRGPAIGYGSKLNVGEIGVVAPGADRYTRSGDETRYAVTMGAPEEMQAILADHPGAYEQLERHRVSAMGVAPAVAEANVMAMQSLVDGLLEHADGQPEATIEFYRRSLLEITTAPFRAASPYRHRRPQAAQKLVREAEYYLDQHSTQPIHVSELCEHLRVPRRTLYHAFYDVLGIPPQCLARRRRLCAVHEVLRQGGHDTQELIRAVAIAYGFLELGKFAKMYRRLFGERPSETLRHGRAHPINWRP